MTCTGSAISHKRSAQPLSADLLCSINLAGIFTSMACRLAIPRALPLLEANAIRRPERDPASSTCGPYAGVPGFAPESVPASAPSRTTPDSSLGHLVVRCCPNLRHRHQRCGRRFRLSYYRGGEGCKSTTRRDSKNAFTGPGDSAHPDRSEKRPPSKGAPDAENIPPLPPAKVERPTATAAATSTGESSVRTP